MVFLWYSDIRLSSLELVLSWLKANSAVRQNTCIEVHSLISCPLFSIVTHGGSTEVIKSTWKVQILRISRMFIFLGHFSVKLSKLFQITQFHLKNRFFQLFLPVFFSINSPPDHWSTLTGCTDVSNYPIHLLNYQNSFKILPNLGIYLMTFWCPILREKTSWCLWCPDSCPDVHTKAWGPFGRKCPALMQMWEPRSAHVSRILAWGILDQDNTSCLVQGIPALLRTLTWCHWGPYLQST